MSSKRNKKLPEKPSELQSDTIEKLLSIVKKNCTTKFDESVDLSFQINNKQKKNEINIRTVVNPPGGTGKKVNVASYQVKEEDTIEIRDKSKQLALIDIALANKEREVPEYLQLDEKNKKVKFVRVPAFEEVPYPVVMEPNLVIEYYSR